MKYIDQIRLKTIAFQLRNVPLSLYFDIKPIGNSLD